jgi:calcineurin-like phosphoesterase family protein
LIFFTSDTHFGDPRVLALDRRPFASIKAHDDALIAFWNETVGADDVVWHLGDFARTANLERLDAMLARLNGTKHLIIGNNDTPSTIAAGGWASTQHYRELTIDGTMFVLCHYPLLTWNRMGKKSVNLHGHSHGRLKGAVRQHDVGVDAWNYRPVSLEQLRSNTSRRSQTRAR